MALRTMTSTVPVVAMTADPALMFHSYSRSERLMSSPQACR
ncbi:hypothetical protein SAMN05428985_101242 [Nocardioides sp. YR527]|nr:hypothetical protein SAMN05428985_101242 [Nocardioides sp. YR527]